MWDTSYEIKVTENTPHKSLTLEYVKCSESWNVCLFKAFTVCRNLRLQTQEGEQRMEYLRCDMW